METDKLHLYEVGVGGVVAITDEGDGLYLIRFTNPDWVGWARPEKE